MMTHRERFLAVLKYESYDRLPIVHFGYWRETLQKWAEEGHITDELAAEVRDGNDADRELDDMLGWDFGYNNHGFRCGLLPTFETKTLEKRDDGSEVIQNWEGARLIKKPGAGSIPMEVGHALTDRKSWEEEFLPRLQFKEERIDTEHLEAHLKSCEEHGLPAGYMCGSMVGWMRNWLGLENFSFLYADDEDLYEEIIHTVGHLLYQCVDRMVSMDYAFDFAHFWEDICFNHGPLMNPRVMDELAGPHYKKITDRLKEGGIDLVSLDCDGRIDDLLPIWLKNGVNIMFPIEVGTWNASIEPWREQYGRDLRGVGGMRKYVFAQDRAAVDAEIERLRKLVDLGGFIPCPDHRIPPDGEWDNVRYYCDRMHSVFG